MVGSLVPGQTDGEAWQLEWQWGDAQRVAVDHDVGEALGQGQNQVCGGEEGWGEQEVRHHEGDAAGVAEGGEGVVDKAAGVAAGGDQDVREAEEGGKVEVMGIGMTAAQQADKAVVVQLAHADPGFARQADGEAKVDLAFSEGMGQVWWRRDHPEVDARGVALQLGQQLGDDEGSEVVGGDDAKCMPSRGRLERRGRSQQGLQLAKKGSQWGLQRGGPRG